VVTTHVGGLLGGRGKVKTLRWTMDTRAPLSLAQQLAAAQDWWREAGVDADFADEPRNWLEKPAEPEARAQSAATPVAPPEPEIPPLGGPASSWPQSLADFAPWWLASNQLDTGGTAPRIAPRGAADAELMILVAMPEKEDSDRLLSGPQGTLIGNMLKAMGIPEEAAYLAAALPRHARHPDWDALAARELGKLLIHHVNLARPERLLVLGRAMLPLFGHDPAQAGAKPRRIALEGCGVPALVTFGPENLLETARFRRALWQGWLDWTGGDQ
jgi:uracil-DNA glycosylase